MRIILFAEVLILLCNAATISRDYQDSWILEGLEVPFVLFVITYISYFMVEKRFNWLIAFALIAQATFIMIPNLKYTWFQGMAIDQHLQYELASATYNQGHIIPGNVYSDTPLFALSLVINSEISGLPLLQVYKYFPLMLWFTYPIWIYIILRKFGLESSFLKYSLLISSIPVKPQTSYLVVGMLFGTVFVFIILIQLAKLAENKSRRDWIVILISTFALVAGHSVSSMMLSLALLVIPILSFMLYRLSHDTIFVAKVKPPFLGAMTIVVTSVAWLSLNAKEIFSEGVNFFIPYINKLLNIPSSKLPGEFIAPRFFEVSFVDQMKVFLVYNGGDLLLISFTLVGVLIIIKKLWLRKKRGLLFLSFYAISLMVILLFGAFLNLGYHWGDRVLRLASRVAPIFFGVSLFYIETKLRSKAVPLLIIVLLAILGTAELYRCQPLIPAASSLGNQFPSDEPIVYVNLANTAYQRYMIAYAERYLPDGTTIAADKATGHQIYGIANWNFSQNHKVFYPLAWETSVAHDYFLLHLPGVSGGFEEKVENRTRNVILSIIYDPNYDIVYSNGESYILNTR